MKKARRGRAERPPKGPAPSVHTNAPETDPQDRLNASVETIRGVGPAIAQALERRGIRTIEDLLWLIPARYEDGRLICEAADIVEGEENVLLGRVVDSGQVYSRASRKRIYCARIEDATGSVILKWFRFGRAWVAEMCKKGNLLFAAGKVTRYGADLQMVHPRVTVMREGRDTGEVSKIIPVYPEIEGVRQGVLRNIAQEAFKTHWPDIASLIPARVAKDHGLEDLAETLADCHVPERRQEVPSEEALRARLATEEFFLFQCAQLQRKRRIDRGPGMEMRPGPIQARLIDSLPFALTPGQRRASGEIERDMAASQPMNRLLQGDVGCGKTICAVLAASVALDAGCQVAFMAPTEILAEQLYLSSHRLLESIGIKPVLLRGSMGRQRSAVVEGIGAGAIRVIVGTHALLQPDVAFPSLGLAIIDEQHRFGVIQRELLKRKGLSPHMLVMSATPIPRTLSMVVYGDLDVSSIEDMPEGRQRVRTEVVSDAGRQRVYDAVLEETGLGHQVFVVCPVVEESDHLDLISARKSALTWKGLFPDLRLGLLHGRMRAEEKEAIMISFRDGRIDVLVCTTVVEVGIDVPNATLMVVEHAERFGLSQLHQLRGRVGRGPHPSRCMLVSPAGRTTAAARRLKVLAKTADGFAIAEEDMLLRGVGDMFGVRQTGAAAFRVGNVIRDGRLMERARKMAEETMASATDGELALIRARALRRWGGRLSLGDVL